MAIKHFILVILFLGISSSFSDTQQRNDMALTSLEIGINKWSIEDFKSSMNELKKQDSQSSQYWQSVNLFYQSQYYLYGSKEIKNDSLGEVILDSAIHFIESLPDEHSKKPELHAILATLYGMNINVSMWSAFTNGPLISGLMDKALKADSTNPRIQYLLGVSYVFTPSILGGGTDKGRKYLSKAVELYKENKYSIEINWGQSTAMGFIAHSWLKDENLIESQKWIETCLAIKSDDMVCLDAKEKLAKEL